VRGVCLLVALVAPAGVAAGCGIESAARFEHTTVKMHAFAGAVHEIVLRSERGDVDLVQSGERISVRETQHYGSARPAFAQDVANGVLTLVSDCNGEPCDVDLRVTVPSAIKVTVDVAAGDIHAHGIAVRNAHLQCHSGNLSVELGGRQQLVWAHTDSGNVDAVAADASAVDAQSHSGNVAVDARHARSIVARTDSGNVVVSVPAGDYAVDAHTQSGAVRVEGITRNDRAQESIQATTASGNVTVRTR